MRTHTCARPKKMMGLAAKRGEVRTQIERLEKAIATLESTASSVASLQKDVSRSLADLDDKRASTEKLIHEMASQREEAEALAEARPGDFKQRQADRERMERCIGPVLTRVHREKVWQKLQASSCQSDSLTGGWPDSRTVWLVDGRTVGQSVSPIVSLGNSRTVRWSDSLTV